MRLSRYWLSVMKTRIALKRIILTQAIFKGSQHITIEKGLSIQIVAPNLGRDFSFLRIKKKQIILIMSKNRLEMTMEIEIL